MGDHNAHTGNIPTENVVSTKTEPILNENGKELRCLVTYNKL